MIPETIPAVNLKLQYAAIRAEIEAAVAQVFARQNFILGAEVEELEREIARLQDCDYAIGCASGSDALLLSLVALGIGPGDGVIVPSLTFFATAAAVARAGARPVFADIDPRTLNLSPAAAEQTLADPVHGKNVKAIIPVHLYGQCAEMDPLLELARQHELHLIEDAAQAILASCGGRAAGSLGVCGCFSFYPTKNLGGAGDGGMITTRDAELAERLRRLRNHGSADRLTYHETGLNSRLDTLQAAILLVKLRHLKEWTVERRARAAAYRRHFAEMLGDAGAPGQQTVFPSRELPVVLPYESSRGGDGEHVYHQFTIRAVRRDELAGRLRSRGIETAIYYPVPLHRQPAFQCFGAESAQCPEAERAAAEVLSLPLYPELTDEQQRRVVAEIASFYR